MSICHLAHLYHDGHLDHSDRVGHDGLDHNDHTTKQKLCHLPVKRPLSLTNYLYKRLYCTIDLTPRPPFLSLYPLDHSTTILVPINSLPFSCRIASYSMGIKRNMHTRNAQLFLSKKNLSSPLCVISTTPYQRARHIITWLHKHHRWVCIIKSY